MGVNFFSRKIGHEGGVGGGPRASCLWMQKIPIFIFEYFPKRGGFHMLNFKFLLTRQIGVP